MAPLDHPGHHRLASRGLPGQAGRLRRRGLVRAVRGAGLDQPGIGAARARGRDLAGLQPVGRAQHLPRLPDLGQGRGLRAAGNRGVLRPALRARAGGGRLPHRRAARGGRRGAARSAPELRDRCRPAPAPRGAGRRSGGGDARPLRVLVTSDAGEPDGCARPRGEPGLPGRQRGAPADPAHRLHAGRRAGAGEPQAG